MNDYRIEKSVVWIKLTQGKETCVDLQDWPKVSEYQWFAHNNRGYTYYAVSSTGSKRTSMHRLILALGKGEKGDHEDRNGLNNRRYNLRTASHSNNMHNRVRQKSNTSGFKGVYRNGSGWVARVGINGRLVNCGTFPTREDAARAYDNSAKRLHGRFSNLNLCA